MEFLHKQNFIMASLPTEQSVTPAASAHTRRYGDALDAVAYPARLWPQGEAVLSDAAIQRTLGADRYVGSLADAVTEIAKSAPNTAAAAA